jgi:hypothetical protein
VAHCPALPGARRQSLFILRTIMRRSKARGAVLSPGTQALCRRVGVSCRLLKIQQLKGRPRRTKWRGPLASRERAMQH